MIALAHGMHMRTTNPLQSIFAGVRLRTDVAKRPPNRENAQYLLFRVVLRPSGHWRRITGSNLCRLLLEGRRLVDGRLAAAVAA